nr:14K protein [Wheat spindle streak mosaic virus]
AGEMLNEETLARALGIFVPKTNLFLLLATKGLKLVYVVCVLILINLSYQVFQRWQSQVKRKKSSLDSSDELSNTMPVSEGEGILKEVMQMSKEQRNQVKVDMDADVAEHSGGFTFVFPEQAVELE